MQVENVTANQISALLGQRDYINWTYIVLMHVPLSSKGGADLTVIVI